LIKWKNKKRVVRWNSYQNCPISCL